MLVPDFRGSTEEQTHSKIKNIVHPDVIKPDIRMMILNAVYFRANWASVSDTELTSKKPFCTAEKEEREVSYTTQLKIIFVQIIIRFVRQLVILSIAFFSG